MGCLWGNYLTRCWGASRGRGGGGGVESGIMPNICIDSGREGGGGVGPKLRPAWGRTAQPNASAMMSSRNILSHPARRHDPFSIARNGQGADAHRALTKS